MTPNRCRLILIAPADNPAAVKAALAGGDVASLIIPGDFSADEMRSLVSMAQEAGAAALIVNDTQSAGRYGADGVHFEGDLTRFEDRVARAQRKTIVGAGNIRTRHQALVIGETRPDYVMFGKLGGDTHREANPKNLALGEWWAAMVEIPCVVLGGSDVASVTEVATTGAEFVALGAAVFAAPDPAAAVAEANSLLDAHAPELVA